MIEAPYKDFTIRVRKIFNERGDCVRGNAQNFRLGVQIQEQQSALSVHHAD